MHRFDQSALREGKGYAERIDFERNIMSQNQH